MRELLARVILYALGRWRDEEARSFVLHKAGLVRGFSKEVDHLIRSAARAHTLQPNGKRVLFPTGYYFSARSMFLDALFAIHLRLQGFTVVGLSAGEFFENECPLFEPYRRPERLRKNLMVERIVWRRLLGMELIDIGRFARKGDRQWALEVIASNQTVAQMAKIEVEGFAVGHEAALVTMNMANIPALTDDDETRLRLKNHLLNVLRYFRATARLFDKKQYDVLLSQFPFYYKWSIPHQIAESRSIPVYSYTPGEQEGTVIFAKSPKFFQGVDAKPEEQITQGLSIAQANQSNSPSAMFNAFIRSDKRLGITVDTTNEWKKSLRPENRTLQPIEDVPQGVFKRRVFVPLNVHCDLVTLQGSPLFDNYLEFLAEIVRLRKRFESTLQFIVKAHPAEQLYVGDARWRGCAELLTELGWPNAGDSVVIPHTSDVPADELWSQSDAVLTWTSTVALEAVANGLPVIQVGYSHLYEADFLLKPRSLRELDDLIAHLASKKPLTSLLADGFAVAAAAYGLSHYATAQMDIPFLRGTEISRKPLLENTTLEELLSVDELREAMSRVENLESIFPIAGGSKKAMV